MTAAAALAAACGDSSLDADAAATPRDGGPSPDAGGTGPLDGLGGSWSFHLTGASSEWASRACSVNVTGDGVEVTCPGDSLPREVGAGCRQLRDDAHLTVTIGQVLAGRVESIVEFQGDGCAALGHTTGAPYPTPPSALLGAEQQQYMTLAGVLSALGGTWHYHADDPSGQGTLLGCSVVLSAEALGVAVTAICPLGEATTDGNCIVQNQYEVDAHLTPLSLDGTLRTALRHAGESCDAPDVVQVDAEFQAALGGS